MEAEWQALQAILTNPDVAYVLLVIGLWAVVAAWATPGTGFPEAAAVICLALAALGLIQLPVNVIGLAVVAVAVGLFVVDLKVQSVGLTLGAATGLALGSLLLFRPGAGAAVSRWLIAGATLGSLGIFGLVLSAAVRAQRLAVKTDPKAVVGMEGVATTDVDPVGAVQVRSELWTAVADGPIPAGARVRVLAVEGVRLRVVPAGRPAEKKGDGETQTE